MIILALDTSGPSLSIAIAREGALVYEATLHSGLAHSQNLMPMVESALNALQLKPSDLSLLAVADGPGSFTGVRIGVAAAKGLARAFNTPCVGIDALEALAWGTGEKHDVICPMRDARAGQVYGAAFQNGQRLLPDAVLQLTEYMDQVRPLGKKLLFVGDGVAPYRARIMELLGEQALFVPPHLMLLKAGAVAALAMQRPQEYVLAAELLPRYLRAPQAERLRAQKQEQND